MLKIKYKIILFIVLCLACCAAFSKAAENPASFSFVQLTDPQLGFGGYEHDVNSFSQAVEQINALKPDFVLICGDLVNNFTEKSIADFNEIKSRLTVPCYLTPGNHDIGDRPSAETLKRYRDTFGKDYFSFEHKGYTFVIANSSLWKSPLEGESQKQDEWFRKTLEAAHDANSPVFVVQHYPIFLKNPDESDSSYNLPTAKRKELLALLESNGVVAFLSGHRHETVINNYKSMQLVSCEATSRNLDRRPFGFRVWHVSHESIKNEFVPLEQEKK